MKILQIIPSLTVGGAEKFVVELSDELIKQGHDCDVVEFYHGKEQEQIKPKKARVKLLPKRSGFDIMMMFKLIKYIKQHDYDVVHVHTAAVKYILLASLLLRKVKFVATIHSDAKFDAGASIDKWSRKLMFKFKLCTPVTISDESLISFGKFYGYGAAMVYNGVAQYIPQGIELHDNPDQLIFLHVASCQPVKNQTLLITAFNQVVHDFPNIKLIWIGSNNAYSQLFEQLSESFGDKIEYHGVVENVREYLYSSDAMCLSSKKEGMPMSIIEAFSVGCPVLCTPVGGCINMIDNGNNGLLSRNLSVEAYKEMLRRFCSFSKKDREKISQMALTSFEKYSITSCASKYLGIYK